ncbi:MAG: pyrimidine/purine nucleoside phosphorylase [Leptospiraceae bacterium]|nr:pyrimidine/purine nucleoside phosphorylase [Leptospiraceae bacterium]MCK6379696.1 pyrimidine/purine nucleoside phosphorylase [Leptospiraceae bacterium]NUM41486.1 pyrimidine/purine nucleoside phosphorylase [Leptospiraceae bacterium]
MLKVNEYFNGNVKSISFQTEDSPATVGVISSGKYEFDTTKKEILTITSGSLKVQLPESDWKVFTSGESFTIEAGKIFHVNAEKEVSYICRYY